MTTESLDSFSSLLGQIAVGSLQGRAQARSEAEEEQRQQQQQALQIAPLLMNAQDRIHRARMEPYEALTPYVNQMDPESRARFLSSYTTAAGQPSAPLPWGQFAKAFDEDSPLRSIFQGMGGGEAPQVYQGGQMAPGMRLAGQPAPVTAPPGASGAGLPPQPGAPPAGGLTPGHYAVTGPGGMALTFGPDPHQVTAARAEVARMAPRFSGKDLPAEFRTQTNAALARANQQLDQGDLEGARQTIAQLQGLEVDIPRQRSAGAASQYTSLAHRYDAKWREFQQRPLPGAGAYASIHGLREMETQAGELAKEHPELAAGMDNLAPYSAQIDAIETARARDRELSQKKQMTPEEKAERDQARAQWQGLSQDLHDQLRWGQTETQHATTVNRAMGVMRQWLDRLSPEQRNPESVAEMLESGVFGARMPEEARYIREHGLNFGGAEANKATLALIGRMGEFMKPGTRPESQRAYAEELRRQSALTGHPISLDPDQLTRLDPKAVPGTPEYRAAKDTHDRMLLEIDRLRRQKAVETSDGHTWANAELNLSIKQAKSEQLKGGFDPNLMRSVAIKRMSAAQTAVDQAYGNYNRWKAAHPALKYTPFDPEGWLKQHPAGDFDQLTDPTQRQGTQLYKVWQDSVKRQEGLFSLISKQASQRTPAPASGASAGRTPRVTTRPAAPAGALPPALAGKTRGEIWNILGKHADPHERNVLMERWFPGSTGVSP